jgi:Nucleoside-diphosphate-sugar epimerases
LREGLRDSYAIRGVDIAPGGGVNIVADMADVAAAQSAFAGVECVIDLAANSDADAPWETVRVNNLPATVNAFEAARLAGVKRIVFASSNHVIGMYERDEPYASVVAGRYHGLDPRTLPRLDETSPIRPDGPYAIGKAFGEAAARFYWEEHGISIICLRIGTVNRENRPTNARHFATLLTHRDLIQLVRLCVTAPPSVGFAIVYGVSANTWRMWDIDRSRDLIGYAPSDNAEQWR